MSKRTDTFLFVLIQKISSVGVQTGVVLYGSVTLLMTSFDVQQHHGAARHFTSVSAIAQEQIFPNWDMPANCWWCGENLVEFGRIDLEAERLNRGVLKRKTDLRGGPFIWIWCRTRNRTFIQSYVLYNKNQYMLFFTNLYLPTNNRCCQFKSISYVIIR